MLICPEALSGYGTFDTRHVREIHRIGYAATLERMDAIRQALRSTA